MFYFIVAMLTPWLLGFVVVRTLLKQRYGYLSFALGAGYPVGLFLMMLGLRFYEYLERPFSLNILLIFAWAITLPLLALFPAKPCTIEELRLEKAPSNWVYLVAMGLVALLLYRWGFFAIDLTNEPVFSWKRALSAKSAFFYYQQNIPISSEYLSSAGINLPNNTIALPDFASLIQTYTALAWGDWNDKVISFPWLLANIALFFSTLGGLRYLSIGLLPSILTAYAVVSFPIIDAYVNSGGYSEIWGTLSLLLSVLSLTMILVHNEWKLLFLLLLAMVAIYVAKQLASVFLLVLPLLIVWRFLGGVVTIIFVLGIGTLGYLFNLFPMQAIHAFFNNLIVSNAVNPNITTIKQPLVIANELMQDNWHYLFLSGLISLLYLFKKRRKHQSDQALLLLIIAAVSMFFIMLSMLYIPSIGNSDGDFNRITLYVAPILMLIPVCIYQLVSKDEETIPTI